MNTRSLTGWLLVIGPILTFIVLAGLYSALIGDGDPGPAAVADLMKNTQLSLIVTSLGSIVFVATFIGMALLANSMSSGISSEAISMFDILCSNEVPAFPGATKTC